MAVVARVITGRVSLLTSERRSETSASTSTVPPPDPDPMSTGSAGPRKEVSPPASSAIPVMVVASEARPTPGDAGPRAGAPARCPVPLEGREDREPARRRPRRRSTRGRAPVDRPRCHEEGSQWDQGHPGQVQTGSQGVDHQGNQADPRHDQQEQARYRGRPARRVAIGVVAALRGELLEPGERRWSWQEAPARLVSGEEEGQGDQEGGRTAAGAAAERAGAATERVRRPRR